jgi:hypothetical protein
MSASTPDPFAPTADTERYLPRAASEAALAELEGALRDGATRILLHGPPGIGKTLLMHVLAKRSLSHFRLAEASYPALPPGDLCRWARAIESARCSYSSMTPTPSHLRRPPT